MTPIRFGCIGCGGMGMLHAANAAHVSDMKIVAFADIDEAVAQRAADTFGADYATTDAQRIIDDPQIDAVLIQTGERHHPRLGIAAARAGKHIFMEKPIAVTVEEAIELETVVNQTGVKYLIGLCNRLAPMVVRAKQMLPDPWITLGQCSDTVSGQACHNLDLIVHLFHEAPLISVYATGGRAYGLDEHLPADSFTATLKFADGSQATYIQHGKAYNAAMTKYSLQLFGRDQCVYLAERFKQCILSKELSSPVLTHRFDGPDFTLPTNPDDHLRDVRGPHGYMGHYEELVALCKAIREDTEPPMTVAHGRHVLQVEKAILESVETGEVIDYEAFLARWGSAQPDTVKQKQCV